MARIHQHLITLALCLLSVPALAGYDWKHNGTYPYSTANSACAAYYSEAGQSYHHLDIKQTNSNPDGSASYTCVAYNKLDQFLGIVTIYKNGAECPAFMHEPDPVTGRQPVGECGCEQGWVDVGEGENPRCQFQEEKEDCAEKGEYYEQGGYCAPECASGSALGSVCLDDPTSECTSESEDYVGSIGFGDQQSSVCGDNQCPNGGDYAFKQDSDGNYQAQCLPGDANPPKCPSGSVVVVGSDDTTFQCAQINKDQPDGETDNPDGDSDGDGEADTNGMAKQLQEIIKNQKEGNSNTNNINETLKGIGKNIKDGTQSITDAIGNIPGGGGGGSGDGTGDGETPDPVTWSGEPIDTELTDPTEEYDQVMADYQAKLNDIKGEVQSMFSTNLTGGGSVDDNTKTIMGVDVNFSLNRFLAGLDILGAIVLFCAAFISAGILFTSRG